MDHHPAPISLRRVIFAGFAAWAVYLGAFGRGSEGNRVAGVGGALLLIALVWLVGVGIRSYTARLTRVHAAREGLTLRQFRGRERFAIWFVAGIVLIELARAFLPF